jgi:hypothetical protein
MSDRDRRVGQTGARFGRVARDETPAGPPAAPPAPEPAAPAAPAAPPPVVARPEAALAPLPAGARYGGSRKERKAREAAIKAARRQAYEAAEDAARAAQAEADRIAAYQQTSSVDEVLAGVEDSGRIRPYVHTGGRTRSRLPLPMEALVTAARGTSPLALRDSHRAVFEMCRQTQSVAEVSARLRVPLGVARVLIDDLAAANAVVVHSNAGDRTPDLMLMERVLAGLRRL